MEPDFDKPTGAGDKTGASSNRADESHLDRGRKSSKDEHYDADYHATEANNKSNPSTTFGRWETFHNRLKKVGFHDWVMLAATVAIAVSTILYTVYARGQLKVMSDTLAEMKSSGQTATQQMWSAIRDMDSMAKSMDLSVHKLTDQVSDTHELAEAAKRQAESSVRTESDTHDLATFAKTQAGAAKATADTAKQQAMNTAGQLQEMRKDQRAWIYVAEESRPEIAVGKALPANIHLTNVGKTPALNILVDMDVDVVPNGYYTDFTEWQQHMAAGLIIPDTVPGFKGIVITVTRARTGPLTQAEFDSLEHGDAYVVLYGNVTYSDVFHTTHWTKFCFWSNALHPVGNYSGRECTAYNSIDDN